MSVLPTQTLIGHVFADAVTRQVPSEPNIVTKHPIEDGSIIAEHVAEGENTLVLECTFTDDVYSFNTEAGAAIVTETTADDKRDSIYKMKRDRMIVNIQTMKDAYPSMVLIDIQEDITVQNSSAFVATLVFERVQLASTAFTSVPLDKLKKKAPAKRDAGYTQQPTQDQGKQAPEEANDEEVDDAVGDAFGAAFGGE